MQNFHKFCAESGCGVLTVGVWSQNWERITGCENITACSNETSVGTLAHGYKQVWPHYDGECTAHECVVLITLTWN